MPGKKGYYFLGDKGTYGNYNCSQLAQFGQWQNKQSFYIIFIIFGTFSARLVHYKEELTAACKMTQMVDATPQQLCVTPNLCLSESVDGTKIPDIQPYKAAIEELRRIRDHYTMLSKLECVGKCSEPPNVSRQSGGATV